MLLLVGFCRLLYFNFIIVVPICFTYLVKLRCVCMCESGCVCFQNVKSICSCRILSCYIDFLDHFRRHEKKNMIHCFNGKSFNLQSMRKGDGNLRLFKSFISFSMFYEKFM